MEEIKVGEYVRFSNGKIRKIIGIDVDGHLLVDIYISGSNLLTFNEEADIVKHSKNIIDLIEIGDYVNGYKILEIADSIYENSKRILVYKNQKESYERWIYIQEFNGKIHTQDDITSILTKEKFESESYKI